MLEIIDLSYSIHDEMMTFDAPWHTGVSVIKTGEHEVVGRQTQRFILGTHTGTHIDAPLHFIKEGIGVDELSLHSLIGEVRLVDFSHLTKNTAITEEMLVNIPFSKRMIFYFGWGKYWNSREYFKDYPFFTEEAAEYLISSGVILVGMDTPSPDDSRVPLRGNTLNSPRDSPIHKVFLKKRIILLEYLANLDTLPDFSGWSIIALPLKLRGADGSPARVCLLRRRQ